MSLLAWIFWIYVNTITLYRMASSHGNTSYGIITHHSEDSFKNTRTLDKYFWEYLTARLSIKLNLHISNISQAPSWKTLVLIPNISLYLLKIVTWLLLSLSERSQSVGVINAICYLFSPSHHLDIWLFILIKPIDSVLFLFKVLKTLWGKKLAAKAIGANKALDSLCIWSSLPLRTSSTVWIIQYLIIWIVINAIKTHLLFMTYFQEQLATVSVSAVPEPHGYAAFSAVTVPFSGVGCEAVITDAWKSYTTAHTKRQRKSKS